MSLNIYIDGYIMPPEDKEIVYDVEAAAMGIDFYNAKLADVLLREIEQSTRFDNTFFKDRFGGCLYYSNLSTGCKAAVCVANYTDKVISVFECGTNAINSIVKNCRDGNILLHGVVSGFDATHNSEIDVVFNGYRFTSPYALNRYIAEDMEDDFHTPPSYEGGWESV